MLKLFRARSNRFLARHTMPSEESRFFEKLFIASQHLMPRVTVSRLMGLVGDSTCPWIKNPFIRWFQRRFDVDMREALVEEPTDYESFNAFFTRALKPQARPIQTDQNALLCPCDGALLSQGPILQEETDQSSSPTCPLATTPIKGHSFTLSSLLANQRELIERFSQGHISIIYLAPKDYHRVHMPVTGRLLSMTHVPGTLYSVNDLTVKNVPGVFAKNERVLCTFDTPNGLVCVILVGALIVGSIATSWAGVVSPTCKAVSHTRYSSNNQIFNPITLEQGQEMGRFLMGSTVILLTEKSQLAWNPQAQHTLKMGQPLAQWTS